MILTAEVNIFTVKFLKTLFTLSSSFSLNTFINSFLMEIGYRSPSRPIPVHVFSNSSDVIDSSFGLLDGEQLVDNKWRHQLDDNKEQNSLQYDDTVEDNSNDSWWVEAIRVVEDMESKQTKTELSTMVSNSKLYLNTAIYITMVIRFPSELLLSCSTTGLEPYAYYLDRGDRLCFPI